MKGKGLLGLMFLAIFIAGGSAQEIAPVAVSPGSESGLAVVAVRCPTFSWSSIQWAVGYRLAVFEATSTETMGYEAMAAVATPVLAKEIQGQALSWTPSARERLRDGGLYVWYVEALDGSGQGVWSAGEVFQVEVEGSVGRTEERLAKIEERVSRGLKEKGVSEEAVADLAKAIKSGVTGGEIAEDFSLRSVGQNPEKMGIQGYEGTLNTFYGYLAGHLNGSGACNTFIGSYSGVSNSTGAYNTFLGSYSGMSNTSGSYNTLLGYYAGKNTTGSYNTFVGYSAGWANTTGIYNTIVGNGAGFSNSTGSKNVYLGHLAGYYEKGSNKLYIDNSDTSSPLIYGDFSAEYLVFYGKVGIKQKNPTHLLDVGTNGAYCHGGAWVDGSSRAYKENIEKLKPEEAWEAFQKLEPVKYNYKDTPEEEYLGFVAEDVPDLVAMKDRKGLSAMDVVAVLTKVVQEQQDTIKELQKRIAKLEKKEKSGR